MKPYTNTYKNAAEVLPKSLAQKMARIRTGLVWIPGKGRREIKTQGMAERNSRILKQHRRGRTIRQIAEKFYLCEERVRQIIRESNDAG